MKKTKVEEEKGRIYSSSLGSFQVIPQPIFDIIFSYLAEDFEDVLAIRLTCKLFYKISGPYHVQKIPLRNLGNYFEDIKNQVTPPPAQLSLYHKNSQESYDQVDHSFLIDMVNFPRTIKKYFSTFSSLSLTYLELDVEAVCFNLDFFLAINPKIRIFYRNSDFEEDNYIDCNPLLLAVFVRMGVETVEKLITRGCDVNYVNSNNETALLYACKAYDSIIIRILLKNGADPNIESETGETALYCALKRKNNEAVKALLYYGAKTPKSHPDKKSCLYYSINNGTSEISKLLLENGADPNEIWNEGLTALQMLILRNDLENLTLLLKYGANPNKTNEINGNTTLFYASTINAQFVTTLLHYGADPNKACENKREFTPLYIATKNHTEESANIIKILLENGADPNKAIANGTTPLDAAKEKNVKRIITILEKYGAKVSDKRELQTVYSSEEEHYEIEEDEEDEEDEESEENEEDEESEESEEDEENEKGEENEENEENEESEEGEESEESEDDNSKQEDAKNKPSPIIFSRNILKEKLIQIIKKL